MLLLLGVDYCVNWNDCATVCTIWWSTSSWSLGSRIQRCPLSWEKWLHWRLQEHVELEVEGVVAEVEGAVCLE